MKNILIIKTGHSETFAESSYSSICSLGDVLRTIPIILSHFDSKTSNFTWITDSKAFGIFGIFQDMIELIDVNQNEINYADFDLVINLEKGFSAIGENVFGFTSLDKIRSLNQFENISYKFPILDESSIEQKFSKYFNISSDHRGAQINKKFEVQEEFDIGLNWKSGEKWPEKIIEKKYWEGWSSSLSESMTVSWQEGFDNLEEYILWIARSRTIITLDSLGLHIARILGKNIIVLYGPTKMDSFNSNGCEEYFFYRNLDEKEKLHRKIIKSLNLKK